jgi:hypothetical protein
MPGQATSKNGSELPARSRGGNWRPLCCQLCVASILPVSLREGSARGTEGVPEVTSGRRPLFVPGDINVFSEHLRNLLCDPLLRAQQGALVRKLPEALPRWQDTVNCVRQAILKVSQEPS